jgi:hypothetical protein
MRGAIPPLPLYIFMAWYLVNYRDSFIFTSKREKVTGGWKRRHNEKLHDLYASPNIIRVIKSRRMRWAVHVLRMEGIRDAHRILVGRRRRRCEDNIKIGLREVVREVVDSNYLANGGLL